MRPPIDRRLGDADADVVRRSHAEAIKELQALPAAGMQVISGVAIAVNGATMVGHKLGRAPVVVMHSVPRVTPAAFPSITAGVIVELGPTAFTSGNPLDRTKVLQIGAFGYSVPIVIDVLVM